MEENHRVHQTRFSLDDNNITSSTMSDNPETDSFMYYSPSFASSDPSIASYKTEKTVNSRKSRYNVLPRHKYAGIVPLGPSQGPLSLDVDVPKPLQTVPLPISNIHIPSLSQEIRTTTRLDSSQTLSPPSLHPARETINVEDEAMASGDDEMDLHTPSTLINQSTPPRVFTSISSSFQALHISLSSTASSALVLQVSSSQPASATCATCAQPLSGESVYAFGLIHHFGCFKCIDCGVVVASKFFTAESGGDRRPLCETDHIRRLNSLCDRCGHAVRGSHVSASDKQWHLEHFTCAVCSAVLAPTDSHYEHERQLYCRQHFLARVAMVKCTGCSSEILRDYVKTADDSCWHLECYMIRKFWNVKVVPAPAAETSITVRQSQGKEKGDIPGHLELRKRIEWQLHHIWTVLNTYEQENAACISDVLREVTNGRYIPAVRILEKILLSVEALFAATDDLETKFALLKAGGIPYVKVAQVLCQGIFEVITFISKHRSARSIDQRAAATLEVLKPVAVVARCFNRLIRIALGDALKLQHEHYIPGALSSFLNKLNALTYVDSSGHKPTATASVGSLTDVATKVVHTTLSEGVHPATSSVPFGYRSLSPESAGISPLAKAQKKYKPPSDLCIKCKLTIAEPCVRLGTYQRWHSHCLQCRSCNKAAIPPSIGPSTAPATASDFLYEPMSIENVPLLGPVPSVVYCMEHAWPTSRNGFLPVSRLEQYAFLLVVSLRRLYAGLKGQTLASQTFPNPWNINGRKRERVDASSGDLDG